MCCLVFGVQAQLEEKEATIADLKSKLERNANEGDNALRRYSTARPCSFYLACMIAAPPKGKGKLCCITPIAAAVVMRRYREGKG